MRMGQTKNAKVKVTPVRSSNLFVHLTRKQDKNYLDRISLNKQGIKE